MGHVPRASGIAIPGSSRAQLIERVISGTALKNSPRLQELLRYLCTCAIEAPEAGVKEQQIGIAVFGRAPGFDTNQDTIVRVGVSKLRKQLQQHFLSEGLHEPVIIEIPKGSYTPLFLPREELQEDHSAPAPDSNRWRTAALALAVALVLTLLVAGWQASRALRPPVALGTPVTTSPYGDHLWRHWLDNGRQTYIVTSDANLLFFSNLMGRPATLAEYRTQDYPFSLFDTYVRDPEVRTLLTRFMRSYLTTTQDGVVAARLTETTSRLGLPATVVYARDLRLQPQLMDNIVLLGHRKGNPWVELFEENMNFVFEWNPEASRGLLVNRKPLAGERETYPAEEQGRTYGTVFYAPRPDGEGSVLVLAGSDMTGLEVGSRFLGDEASCRRLHETLGIALNQPVPPFELLLLARRVVNLAYEPELLAWRRLSK
jgi:hypothetical protein